ncbi:hypothetical protein FH972_022356 [Carpinus fangiana]|uniref:Histone H4 n=1 Tax=Carpinus fangiana TaxID=176857 RepID=A0A5N6KS15_9ROSI|nr:hypothetical protein FH972_022356 [Carpinus fangiana]
MPSRPDIPDDASTRSSVTLGRSPKKPSKGRTSNHKNPTAEETDEDIDMMNPQDEPSTKPRIVSMSPEVPLSPRQSAMPPPPSPSPRHTRSGHVFPPRNPVVQTRKTRHVSPTIPARGTTGAGGKGLGHGSSLRRHRKVPRDAIQGVTKPAIRRLARRGGVKRISADIYDGMRGALKEFLETILRDAVMLLDSTPQKRKVVTVRDVVFALNLRGRTIYGFDDNGITPKRK